MLPDVRAVSPRLLQLLCVYVLRGSLLTVRACLPLVRDVVVVAAQPPQVNFGAALGCGYSPLDMLAVIPLGIVCGLWGAGFNFLNVRLNTWRKAKLASPKPAIHAVKRLSELSYSAPTPHTAGSAPYPRGALNATALRALTSHRPLPRSPLH